MAVQHSPHRATRSEKSGPYSVVSDAAKDCDLAARVSGYVVQQDYAPLHRRQGPESTGERGTRFASQYGRLCALDVQPKLASSFSPPAPL